MAGDVGHLLYTCLPVSLLMIPALLVERQCRVRSLAQSPKDAMSPSQH
jgi:hypothetical protein